MPRIRTRRIDRRSAVWTAADVASILGVEAARVVWHCERAQRLGAGALFFGAWLEEGEWLIPDRAARYAAEAWPRQHYTLAEAAALLRFSVPGLRRKLVIVPDGKPLGKLAAGKLGARLLFSENGKGDVRIPATELDRLTGHRASAA